MKTIKRVLVLAIAMILAAAPARSGEKYTLVVDGFDWGPGVSRVILSMGKTLSSVNPMEYSVYVERSTECLEIKGEGASGERTIIHAYVSDERGRIMDSDEYVTLVLFVSPGLPLSNPFQYVRNSKCRGNVWVDYRMAITHKSSKRVWDTESGRVSKILNTFDLSGRYMYKDEFTMSYAVYTPEKKNEKSPLIIWLHGGGEGGTDPTVPLLANRAANYASDEIQTIFKGAYVLVPQCPGAWMHNAEGVMNHGEGDDVYHKGLMEFIKDFVMNHPDIDSDRIYVGGCSNGGYMSLKLILQHPDYFAAGFISALAYQNQYISDEQIESIKEVPIWFVHAADDRITIPDQTVLPVYKRLIEAGARDVHLSYYDHVVDITGFFGGENYHYEGHWSWIYCHANQCRLDYDGFPVELNGRPVHIMDWVAAQSK
ncbi:MAG: prolyl oligopeptidase family serine peptidase [Bacteroidota bacterium]|nr:prolyl oligopeptidase family serine peptidase [Bacteroidota bacterium]